MTPSATPIRLRIDEIPKYIRTHYGYDVSRTTVFNWTKRGVSGIVLKTVKVHCRKRTNYGRRNYRVTTSTYVDQFMLNAKPEMH